MIYGNTVEGGFILIAYKGFKPGLECRGYQFHMGLNILTRQTAGRMDFIVRKILLIVYHTIRI